MRHMYLNLTLMLLLIAAVGLTGCPGKSEGETEGESGVVDDGPVTPGAEAGEEKTFWGMDFVWCPKGKFRMGNDANGPAHDVTLSQGFWMAKYEFVQGDWDRVGAMPNTSNFQNEEEDRTKRPVETVTWYDVQEFIGHLNRKSGKVFRLPTEAEWEYACRAGTTTDYSFGDEEELPFDTLGQYAWWDGNRDDSGWVTHDVGQKKANPWGIHDMHGNVQEWCQDWFEDYGPASATDPGGPVYHDFQGGGIKTARGGGSDDFFQAMQSAARASYSPRHVNQANLGFRLIAVLDAGEAPAKAPEIEMLEIEAGTFTMGSQAIAGNEGDPHEVTLKNNFEMGVHEITQGQFEAVMGFNPATITEDEAPVGAKYPATSVTWNEAQEFVNRLNAMTGDTYRLPTEAQWEYACRAGTETVYSFGDDVADLATYANYDPAADEDPYSKQGEGEGEPVPDPEMLKVGQLDANPWELFDMHGNVREWVHDGYATYLPDAVTDPMGPENGGLVDNEKWRVIRGGGYLSPAASCTSAYRMSEYRWEVATGYIGTNTRSDVGFRIVRQLKAQAAEGEVSGDGEAGEEGDGEEEPAGNEGAAED